MTDSANVAWPGLSGWAGPILPVPTPSLRHLRALSGPAGLYEHACLDRPRTELGCCTDDAGRALALACRLAPDPDAQGLAHLTLAYLERAHLGGGNFRLRLRGDGEWSTDPPSDDATGRALLGLGVAASSSPWEEVRRRSAALFSAAAGFRSRFVRATAYAVQGAAAVARVADGAERMIARHLLDDAVASLLGVLGAPADKSRAQGGGVATAARPPALPTSSWAWPEPCLGYANALVPAAAIGAGSVAGRDDLVDYGLSLLAWLVDLESLDGRFSFTPVGGRMAGGPQPAWDQQPIEAGAMAFASACALSVSGDNRWRAPLEAAVQWWLGRNDNGAVVFDPVTCGGYDGLTREGVNRNQGAESTIAFVGTMALAAQLRARPSQAPALSAPSSSGTEAVAAPT